MKKTIILLFFLISVCWQLFAQENMQSFNSVVAEYVQQAGNNALVYLGRDYEGYPLSENHPFLIDFNYTKARLVYHNVVYPDILLRLDLSRNELMVQTPNFRHIVLDPDNIEYAEMFGKHVIYFHSDTLPGCPTSGYYILLHSGNCKVMEKRSAIMSDLVIHSRASGLRRSFSFFTKYYLYKDGEYHKINSKNSLLKALSPYKKELKQTISSQYLNFKSRPEEFLIQTVIEYEKLSGL
jgi:hypothetical protein